MHVLERGVRKAIYYAMKFRGRSFAIAVSSEPFRGFNAVEVRRCFNIIGSYGRQLVAYVINQEVVLRSFRTQTHFGSQGWGECCLLTTLNAYTKGLCCRRRSILTFIPEKV
jgi:hypothetical protein